VEETMCPPSTRCHEWVELLTITKARKAGPDEKLECCWKDHTPGSPCEACVPKKEHLEGCFVEKWSLRPWFRKQADKAIQAYAVRSVVEPQDLLDQLVSPRRMRREPDGGGCDEAGEDAGKEAPTSVPRPNQADAPGPSVRPSIIEEVVEKLESRNNKHPTVGSIKICLRSKIPRLLEAEGFRHRKRDRNKVLVEAAQPGIDLGQLEHIVRKFNPVQSWLENKQVAVIEFKTATAAESARLILDDRELNGITLSAKRYDRLRPAPRTMPTYPAQDDRTGRSLPHLDAIAVRGDTSVEDSCVRKVAGEIWDKLKKKTQQLRLPGAEQALIDALNETGGKRYRNRFNELLIERTIVPSCSYGRADSIAGELLDVFFKALRSLTEDTIRGDSNTALSLLGYELKRLAQGDK
jgi:hypothetical protein